MQEFHAIVRAATEEQRQNLAEMTNSGFGSSPDILRDHIRYLRSGSIGQMFHTASWKQVVTDQSQKQRGSLEITEFGHVAEFSGC